LGYEPQEELARMVIEGILNLLKDPVYRMYIISFIIAIASIINGFILYPKILKRGDEWWQKALKWPAVILGAILLSPITGLRIVFGLLIAFAGASGDGDDFDGGDFGGGYDDDY
jgi:hypothetical protein